MKSADGEERGAEKKGARRGEEASHLFLQKEGAQRHTGSSLPPAAGSQERAGERQWSRGEGTQSECCLSPYVHGCQLGPPDPHTATPRSLQPSDTAQKTYGRPSPPPRGEQTWPLKARFISDRVTQKSPGQSSLKETGRPHILSFHGSHKA